MPRLAEVSRKTAETQIVVSINLDGNGTSEIDSGIGFLDHMLDQIARHGQFDLKIQCKGDLHIDGHHTVEDIGIALGECFAAALGNKAGIERYGMSYVPLDEAMSRTVIDLSGRPYLEFHCDFTAPMLGTLDTQLVREFFLAFASNARVTLHIDNIRGINAHHQCETIFKSFGRALRAAVSYNERLGSQLPSTKGLL